ncbi:LOB domain-containing protein 39-like [Rhododendron vialii]|uniref:LOB domain-containing protein 39-like n=1 Tax=Rhododendron vialii TaxID=182163 RepID=UPI00265F98B7|nr:LOB domain-containing protein 39-like [Rhododendron vialii]
MSCNGCRALRKGCSQSCILRPCLDWIESPQAQINATLFVSKFFGRSDLMCFIATVPEKNRPDLFQSLLFEACGRTVNPVNGVLGLLSTGNWHICQMAVKTVLSGGTLRPMGAGIPTPQTCELASDDFRATRKWYDIDNTKQSDLEKNEMTISFNSDSEESAGSMISFDGGDYEVKTSLGGEEPKLLNLFV